MFCRGTEESSGSTIKPNNYRRSILISTLLPRTSIFFCAAFIAATLASISARFAAFAASSMTVEV